MRLLTVEHGAFAWATVNNNKSPPYAILSHTWEVDNEQEVTFRDLESGSGQDKDGFRKLLFCAHQAQADGIRHFWIDSACIDRSSSAELQEAINSMYRWYAAASKCYVYLSDVPGTSLDERAFRDSRWFTRGWTLPELIAPSRVEFFTSDGYFLGSKADLGPLLYDITRIQLNVLRQPNRVSAYDVDTRLSWVTGRSTTKEEDEAYCLLGIFNTFMPLIYGEGKTHAFRRLKKKIRPGPQTPRSSSRPPDAQKAVMSLDATDQVRDLNTALANSTNTCAWVFEKDQYLAWFNAKHSSLLWMNAKAGHGKTTLAAHIINTLHEHQMIKSADQRTGNENFRSIILYFFFQRSNHTSVTTASAAYGTMIKQLVGQVPSTLALVIQRHMLLARRGRFDWPLRRLEDLLADMIREVQHQKAVYIVLDGFDDCTEEGRESIMDWIQQFMTSDNSAQKLPLHATPKVKILITSRSSAEWQQDIPSVSKLDIQLEDTAKDVHTMIKSRVEDLAKRRHLGPEISNRIEQFLKTNAHGMFLWVKLIMQELEQRNQRLTNELVEAKLSRVPLGLEDTYRVMLEDTVQDRRKDTWTILRWLIHSTRHLTLEELHAGLSIEYAPEPWHDLQGDINYLFGALIHTDGDKSLVTFVHPSARRYLQEYIQDLRRSFDGISMSDIDAHEHLAVICLRHFLESDCLARLVAELSGLRGDENEADVFERHFESRCPFCRYAAESWDHHLRVVGNPSEELAGMVQQVLQVPQNRDGLMALRVYLQRRDFWKPSSQQGGLHLAAYFGIPWLVRSYVEKEPEAVDATTIGRCTPILFASEMGNTDSARILLEAKADPNVYESDGWSALHWAARNGHREILTLLLQQGAKIDQEDADGHDAFDWAVDRENWEAAALLLMTYLARSNHNDNQNIDSHSTSAVIDEDELQRWVKKLKLSYANFDGPALQDSRLDLDDIADLSLSQRDTAGASEQAVSSRLSVPHDQLLKPSVVRAG